MCACSRSRRERKGRTDATTASAAVATRTRVLVTLLTLVGISPQLVASFLTQQSNTLAATRPTASSAKRYHHHRTWQGDALLKRRRSSHVAAAVAVVEAAAEEVGAPPSPMRAETSTAGAGEHAPLLREPAISVLGVGVFRGLWVAFLDVYSLFGQRAVLCACNVLSLLKPCSILLKNTRV